MATAVNSAAAAVDTNLLLLLRRQLQQSTSVQCRKQSRGEGQSAALKTWLHFPPYRQLAIGQVDTIPGGIAFPLSPPAFYLHLLFAESQLKHEYKHELCCYKLAKT